MEDFVTFEIAKKLKEKGFDCKYPLAIYDEGGLFYPLFTSCDEDENSNCIFGKRLYYDYEDFLDNKSAIIAPTISQVLKWLREKKEVYVSVIPEYNEFNPVKGVTYRLEVAYWKDDEFGYETVEWLDKETYTIITFDSYEKTLLEGIEYVIDNLI